MSFWGTFWGWRTAGHTGAMKRDMRIIVDEITRERREAAAIAKYTKTWTPDPVEKARMDADVAAWWAEQRGQAVPPPPPSASYEAGRQAAERSRAKAAAEAEQERAQE